MIEKIAIPKYKIDYLKKAIKKLNKKAVKIDCEPLKLSFDNEHTETYNRHPITDKEFTTPLIIEMIDAILDYEIPVIQGYELIATLDIFPGENSSEIMISAVPNKEIPNEYKNRNHIACEHCNKNRRRNHSILLRHIESNEYKEVGSTCVKDFFGHDPSKLLFLASLKFSDIVGSLDDDDIMDLDGYQSRNVCAYDLDDALIMASATIKMYGWVSSKEAYEKMVTSTKDMVFTFLNPPPKLKKSEMPVPDESDKTMALNAIEYFENADTDDNDYLLNCQKLTLLGYVPFKYMGFAVSMISSYKKHIQRELDKANTKQSEWQGSLKARLTNIPVTCTFVKEINSDWGLSVLYSFKDTDGNIYKTFYSGKGWTAEQSKEYHLTGTVKKHAEWNDIKETHLNRCIAN